MSKNTKKTIRRRIVRFTGETLLSEIRATGKLPNNAQLKWVRIENGGHVKCGFEYFR